MKVRGNLNMEKTKKSYHHGNLREELIEKGIELINEAGEEKLSLRKVAKMCGVSPTTINLIRTGNGLGYRKTLRKIAKVLKVNANEIGD